MAELRSQNVQGATGARLNERLEDALTAGGRGSSEELGVPIPDDRARLDNRLGVPILTRTTTAAAIATGAAECIAMHSEQWSASLSRGCMCATWTTATIASKARQSKAVAPKARGFRRRPLRISGCNPVSKNISNYKDTLDWTRQDWRGFHYLSGFSSISDQPAGLGLRVDP